VNKVQTRVDCVSPIGRFPRWRIGESSPDIEGRWEIKYHLRTKADEDWPTALEAEEDIRVSTATEAEENVRVSKAS
jgi:hypothetical protein